MTVKKATATTPAPKSRKPRPSRSKAAVAARAAEGEATQKAGMDWFVKTVQGEGATVTAGADVDEALVSVPADAEEKALERLDWKPGQTITLNVTPRYVAPGVWLRPVSDMNEPFNPDVDHEVVRALADVDTADEFATQVSDSTWDFMADVAEGVTPAMQQQTLLVYYDRVRDLEAENTSLKSRLKDAIAAAEIFDRLLGEEKAKLEELEASTDRSLKTLREQKETVVAERDAARRRVTELDGMLKTWMDEHDRLHSQREATSEQLIQRGAELDAAEERIDYLEAELDYARRPWIARVFRRA